MSQAERLLRASPLAAVLRLAVPTSTVMVLGATSSVLHTYFVSRLGADAIAAVSLVFPIHLILLTMMGGGVGAGVSAAIAQTLGAGKLASASSVASHAVWMTTALGVVITGSLLAGAPGLFRLMGGEGTVHVGATAFARVLFGGAIVTFTVSTLDSMLRGEGNVRIPSIWAAVSLSLQIAFTPLFMFVFGWGLLGAAGATIAGQTLGAVPRLWFVFSGRATVRPRLLPVRPSWKPVAAILRVAVPASLATLTNYVGLVMLTSVIARYGRNEIAAFGLGTRLDFLVITLAFGVGSAVLTLVGLAWGAGERRRIAAVVSRGAALVSALLVGVAALLVWRPEIWLGLFTDDPDILEVGSRYLRAVGPSYPFVGVSMILGFAFQGLGRAVIPLFLVAGRTLLVVSGAVVSAKAGADVGVVFVLMAAGNVLSTLLLGWRWLRTLSVVSVAGLRERADLAPTTGVDTPVGDGRRT